MGSSIVHLGDHNVPNARHPESERRNDPVLLSSAKVSVERSLVRQQACVTVSVLP